ncbi:hypothetical protein Adt_03575 [Abeliophyllum distichum]|uniref:Uncharacterized protein n=1 Tax=Abeliophyllum distichum TaxID=126358 RepID=A0ABD1VZ49_9LAMI
MDRSKHKQATKATVASFEIVQKDNEALKTEVSNLKCQVATSMTSVEVLKQKLCHKETDFENLVWRSRESLAIKEVKKLVQSKLPEANQEFFKELGVDIFDVKSDFASFNSLETIEDNKPRTEHSQR